MTFQEDESPRRSAQHLRHDREQRELQGDINNTIPQQVRSVSEESSEQRDGHSLVFPAVHRRPPQPPRCTNVHSQHVRERSQRTKDNPLPSLHNSHRHAQHRSRL